MKEPSAQSKSAKEPSAQSKSKKKPVNSKPPIIVSGCLFAALFLFMTGYLVRFVSANEQKMVNNSYNSRQEILLSQNYRGTIYSKDGDVLAETLLDEEQNETRVYPYDELFAHVVGYSTKGRTGIEDLANYYLINTNTALSNKVANDIAGVKNPGDNVYTTLDLELQQVAEEHLSVYNGAIVVTEVSTGKILAMVSHPTFDPNEIGELWEKLLDDKDSAVLLNRATQGLYPPGSTFKIATALELIRQDPNAMEDYSFQCNGYFSHNGEKIICFHGKQHGKVDLECSFAKSCNSSFANIGIGLDREKFAKTLEGLLFNKELPVDLSYSKSSMDVSDELPDITMMQTAMGQGHTLITPLHLNMITCAIANDGVLMKPYVIDRVVNDAGEPVKTFHPKEYGRLMSVEEAEILTTLMTAVVESGTATKLSGREYTVAGKTGSAEYSSVDDECHAWFTGFAPAEDPEICVTIIMEETGSGGDYAVPIVRRILDAYFEGKK